MVKITETLREDTIKLGVALDVNRYNDGLDGVKKVFGMLSVSVGVHNSKGFVQLDNRRILSSEGIVTAQQRSLLKIVKGPVDM